MNDTVEFQASFDQCDPAGILFFGNYFHWTNRALEVLVERWGIGWQEWFNNPHLGVPLKTAASEYFQPVNVGEPIQLQAQLVTLRNSGVEFHWNFYNASTLKARLKTVHVFVDRDSRKKCEIPEGIRKVLEAKLTSQ